MTRILLLAFLLLPFAALAQSETCPRVWRSGDSLLTDPAPRLQWYRNGVVIEEADSTFVIPAQAGVYQVEVWGEGSATFAYNDSGFTLRGYVFDTQRLPVAGATVNCGSASATTDSKGIFMLISAEDKPIDRRTPVHLTLSKFGYWPLTSRLYLHEGHTTTARFMLSPNSASSFNAGRGETALLKGLSLTLPPDALQTEGGTPHTDAARLQAAGAVGWDPDFALLVPGGDLAAVDAGGNAKMLHSFGFLRFEMTTDGGGPLFLRPSAEATLRFHLPFADTARAPLRVPLWRFDEETALWTEEGFAERRGAVYEGRVARSGVWNCAAAAERGVIRGKTAPCAGRPVQDHWLRVGQRDLMIDADSSYWSFVPGGWPVSVGRQTQPVTVGPGEEKEINGGEVLDFDGIAVANPKGDAIDFRPVGFYDEYHFTFDGGATWYSVPQFTNLPQGRYDFFIRRVSDTWCMSRQQLLHLHKPSDCNSLQDEIVNEPVITDLMSSNPVPPIIYRFNLTRNFGGRWSQLMEHPCVQELNLSDNRLSELPELIGYFTVLQFLNLSNNRLTDLPASIARLQNLQELNLTNNPIPVERRVAIQALLPNTTITWE